MTRNHDAWRGGPAHYSSMPQPPIIPIWDATTFSKNRERFIDGEVARLFFEAVLETAQQRNLVSSEHFSVDGTLIEAWASQKSFRRKEDAGTPPNDDDRRSILAAGFLIV